MRNHRKVKALRKKFQNGYAIWNMILEHLTESEGNKFSYTGIELELLAGDFEYPAEEIKSVIDYCITLDLLQKEGDSYIQSDTLHGRLKSVHDKRSRQRSNSEHQPRVNGKFANLNSDEYELSSSETPQIKLNKTKLNKSCCYTDAVELEKAAAAIFYCYEGLPQGFDIQTEAKKLSKKYLGDEIDVVSLSSTWIKNYRITKPKQGLPIEIDGIIHKAKLNGNGYVYPTVIGIQFDKNFTKVKLLDGTWQNLSEMQINHAKAGVLKPEQIWKGKTK